MGGNQNEIGVAIVGRDRTAKSFASVARNANTLHGKLVRLGTGLQTVGRSMTMGLTLPLAAVGVASVKLALDFEDSMKKIQGLVMGGSKQSGKAIEKFKQQILDLAPAVGKAPKELADALYFITSSGFKGAKAMSILNASAKASTAGLGETQVVADALTTALNVYEKQGLKAAYATDVMTAAIREGKMEPEEMAQNIGKVLAMAKLARVSFDEVSGALAGMSLAGIKTDEAAVALNQFLTMINKPSAQMVDALGKMGLKFADLRDVVGDKGLVDGMRLMYEHSKKLGKDSLPTMVKALGNVRAARAVFSLMGLDAGKLDGILQRVTKSTGDTERAFKTVAEGSGFKMQKALAELKVVGIELGDELLPVLADVAGGVGDIAHAFAGMPGWAKKAIVWAGLLTAALGPLAYVLGGAAKGMGTLMAVKQVGLARALMGLGGVAGGGSGGGAALSGGAALAGGAAGSVAIPVTIMAIAPAAAMILIKTQKYVAGKKGAAATSQQNMGAGGTFFGSSKGYGGGKGHNAFMGDLPVRDAIKRAEAELERLKAKLAENLKMGQLDNDALLQRIDKAQGKVDLFRDTVRKPMYSGHLQNKPWNTSLDGSTSKLRYFRSLVASPMAAGHIAGSNWLSPLDTAISKIAYFRSLVQAPMVSGHVTTVDVPGGALGGGFNGPKTGYPVVMHGRETIVAHDDPARGLADLANAGIGAAPAGDTFVTVYLDSEPIAARVEVRQAQRARRNARTRALGMA